MESAAGTGYPKGQATECPRAAFSPDIARADCSWIQVAGDRCPDETLIEGSDDQQILDVSFQQPYLPLDK